MIDSWTCYKNRPDVPKLCCADVTPSEPWSGQIGSFPRCGEPSDYLISISVFPREVAVPDSVDDNLAYTGLCLRHTAEMRDQLPAAFIVTIEQFPQPLVTDRGTNANCV